MPKVPILIVGEFNPEDDIKEGAKTVDVWLEKELENIAKSEGITGKIEWSKLRGNKAILIDGRAIFRNPDTQMGLLGDTLNHLALEISLNA